MQPPQATIIISHHRADPAGTPGSRRVMGPPSLLRSLWRCPLPPVAAHRDAATPGHPFPPSPGASRQSPAHPTSQLHTDAAFPYHRRPLPAAGSCPSPVLAGRQQLTSFTTWRVSLCQRTRPRMARRRRHKYPRRTPCPSYTSTGNQQHLRHSPSQSARHRPAMTAQAFYSLHWRCAGLLRPSITDITSAWSHGICVQRQRRDLMKITRRVIHASQRASH